MFSSQKKMENILKPQWMNSYSFSPLSTLNQKTLKAHPCHGEKTPAALIIFHVGLWVLRSSPVYLVKVAWSLAGIGGECRLYSSQTASPPSHFARSLLFVASIPGFKCFPLQSNPSHCLSASFSHNKLHAQFVWFLRCRGWSRFLLLPRLHILLLFFSLLFFSKHALRLKPI